MGIQEPIDEIFEFLSAVARAKNLFKPANKRVYGEVTEVADLEAVASNFVAKFRKGHLGKLILDK